MGQMWRERMQEIEIVSLIAELCSLGLLASSGC